MVTAAILITGNEVLSGRTQDKNVQYIAKRLMEMGIGLKEVRIVRDDYGAIIGAVNELRSSYTYVFTTGGIGPTHDDITAEAMSRAFGVKLVENQEASLILKDYYQEKFNENRARMAMMPEGATLIYNSISKAPGFRMENVFCMAGIPSIMQDMFESLSHTLEKDAPFIEGCVTCNLLEGKFSNKLQGIQAQNPKVEIGSYPRYEPFVGASLVVKGTDKTCVDTAIEEIRKMIKDLQGEIIDLP